jgi:hypothetical protein
MTARGTRLMDHLFRGHLEDEEDKRPRCPGCKRPNCGEYAPCEGGETDMRTADGKAATP